MEPAFSHSALPEKWMKAAVIGSLWAVVEIVLGSLLHNLKIPFAGSILSFVTVYLVMAFFQLWKIPGLIWRAGVVCALMKSLSPSAIILGPMLGILSEALILELGIRILGKNPVAYALGGALAVFSALVQKALTLLVLYGWDFVVLLEAMVQFSLRQIHVEGLTPLQLLLILSGIYLLSGALAGIMGFAAGKKFISSHLNYRLKPDLNYSGQSSLFRQSRKEEHAWPVLLLLFFSLIAGMVLVNRANLLVSSGYAFLFLGFVFFRYAPSIRFLRKWSIWLQFLLILLFSAVFYEGFSFRGIVHPDGWIAGWKMILRALLLLTAFSAIGREMKNPVVKSILYRRGLKNLYLSLEMAFSALPGLMDTFAAQTSRLKDFGKLTRAMLGSSQSLLDEFALQEKNRPTVLVISGAVHSGKSTLAREIVSLLKKEGFMVRGILSVPVQQVEGNRSYEVEEISSGSRELLCSEQFFQGSIKSGRFCFSEKGLKRGKQILEQLLIERTDLVVIDEIGPLELSGGGWAPSVEKLVQQSNLPQLWVVREKLVSRALKKWNIGEVFIFRTGETTPGEVVAFIGKRIKQEV